MPKPKPLSKIGVSKSPWDTRLGHQVVDKMDKDGCHLVVASLLGTSNADNNILLIKESPMLYKGLQEAVVERCGKCKSNSKDWKCKSKYKCPAKEWRKTLASAVGSEDW